MHITLVAVTSLNGKTTRGNEPNIYAWTSPEDTALFESLKQQHNLIVMGRKTYEAAKEKIKLQPDTLRIVLTRQPEKYADQTVKGMLEFSGETPRELVARLEKLGYTSLLLVGGSQVNTIFLKAGMVNEIYLTIEPCIFSAGLPLSNPSEYSFKLQLLDSKQLNDQGTLHVRYEVLSKTEKER